MTRIRMDRLHVVDFEMTCWDGPPPLGEEAEIIEIGLAEIIMGSEPRLGRTASWPVRPVRSRVSPACTALTGITPGDVKGARPLREVCATMVRGFGTTTRPWAGWGRDDHAMARACAQTGISSPFSDSYVNLGLVWAMISGKDRAPGLAAALRDLGLDADMRHRAGPDALDAARCALAMGFGLRRDMRAVAEDALDDGALPPRP